VKSAFLHAWNSYVRHAWGFDELQVRAIIAANIASPRSTFIY
jgi:hypothetical protein